MNPQHHLPNEVLMEYAAGTAHDTTSLLVACHLTLCAACRADVARFEEVGAHLLEQQPETPLPSDALGRLLAQIDDIPQRPHGTTQPAPKGDPRLPLPLQQLLPAGQLQLARWLPGIRGITLRLNESQEANIPPARLVLFGAGVGIPAHDHEAPEYVLVLDGEILDDGQVYTRGDVTVSDEGHVHNQRVSPRGPCLCLIVNEGGIRPQTLWGRLLKRIAGL